jgi:iron(III) transport system permease protein
VALPLGTLVGWMVRSQHTTLPASTTLLGATVSTIGYGAAGAQLSTALAVPVAVMAVRRPQPLQRVLERGAYLVQALPGVVIALAAVFFTTRYAYRAYQTSALLVVVYALLFLPLALVCVKVSLTQASEAYNEVARTLGRGPIATFALVTVPLIAPGLAAAFCLVFLSTVTELTATLILIPIGHHTLVTQFWAYQSATAYGAAAPYAMVMVVVGGIPAVLLNTWFARRVASSGSAVPVIT